MPPDRGPAPPALTGQPDLDEAGPAALGAHRLGIADTDDVNLARYTGPRPADGVQPLGPFGQASVPAPGSPTGPANRPGPGPRGPGRYQKQPVVVEAIRWTAESTAEVREFLGDAHLGGNGPGRIKIDTLEGPMPVTLGDWVIRGLFGEFWCCRADVFAASYEPTDEPLTPRPAPPVDGPWGCR